MQGVPFEWKNQTVLYSKRAKHLPFSINQSSSCIQTYTTFMANHKTQVIYFKLRLAKHMTRIQIKKEVDADIMER